MNDYLEPYEDMSAYSFAVAEKFVEPITNALCKTMGFVFDRKEKRKSFPNHYFKGDEKFIFYKSKNDERAFMIACEEFRSNVKPRIKSFFMTQLNLICLKIVIIPVFLFLR